MFFRSNSRRASCIRHAALRPRLHLEILEDRTAPAVIVPTGGTFTGQVSVAITGSADGVTITGPSNTQISSLAATAVPLSDSSSSGPATVVTAALPAAGQSGNITASADGFSLGTIGTVSAVTTLSAEGIVSTPSASGQPFTTDMSFTYGLTGSDTNSELPYNPLTLAAVLGGQNLVFAVQPDPADGLLSGMPVVVSIVSSSALPSQLPGVSLNITATVTSGGVNVPIVFNGAYPTATFDTTVGASFQVTINANISGAGAIPTGTVSQSGDALDLVLSATPGISFSPSTLPAATVGTAYSQALSGSGGTAPYGNFSIASGALPAGLSLSADGTISGTPTADGSSSFTIQASDSSVTPLTGAQAFTLTVNQPAAFTSASSAAFSVGSAGSFTVAASGFPAPSLSESNNDTLPSGVSLTDNGNGTATLAGTPAAGSGGTYTLHFTAHNGIGADATQTFNLTVNAAPAITTANSATFTAGTAGSFTITTTGAPIATITEAGAALPNGVTFTDNGNGTATLAGTAAAAGSFAITITASNGVAPAASQSFTLTVSPATAAPAITSVNNATFTAGTAGSFTVTTAGTPTPAITETSAALPSGVTFTDNGNGTATLAGTAAAAGTFTITLQAANGVGSNATQTFTLNVVQSTQPLSITTTTLPSYFTQGQAYNATIATTGGVAPIAFSLTAGTLPAGLSLAASTGVISGTPTAYGTSTFTVQAQGASGAPATQAYTVVILPPEFVYNQTNETLVITLTPALPSFQFSEATTVSGGTTSTVYTFTLSGSSAATVSQTFTDAQLTTVPATGSAAVSVIGQGAAGTAVLITDDTYVDTNGATQQTPARISLGSMTNDGVGLLSKFMGNSTSNASYSFLSLSEFPISYAYAGRNDGTIQLYGTAGTGEVGFVTAGYYSYIAAAVTGAYAHFGEGTPSVYGYSAGNAADFAYHYSMNAGSSYVVSGVAYSYMSGSQTNPLDKNATDTFYNVAVGFNVNTGVSNNPGQDFATFYDSPANDTFIGGNAYSYMLSSNAAGAIVEDDAAYGFALIYAESFVGGTDTAVNNDTGKNVLEGGWNVL